MKRKLDPQKTVFLIDGSSFLYRAYYGVRPMHTTKGVPVQAVYNFCRMIQKLNNEWQPQHLVIAWDSKGATVRHELYPSYKATRQEAPSDIFDQKRRIQEFADLIGICQVEKSGIEADDILYSLAQDVIKKKHDAVLITSDKDMGQMIGDHAIMFDWFKNEFVDSEVFEQKYGFAPHKVVFYFSLLGDSSDNIPGVQGIGKVSATELVKQFDSLTDVYENIDKVKKERTRKALLDHKDDALLSEQLFKLRYYDMGVSFEDMAFDSSRWPAARPLFVELEFKSLLKELEHPVEEHEGKPVSLSEKYKFLAVTDQKALNDLCALIRQKKEFAIDTEADLVGVSFTLVGLSIAVEKGSAYYIPYAHATMEQQLDQQMIKQALQPIFEDESIKKYLHHNKFDQHVLTRAGLPLKGIVFDTLIAADLITKDWQRINLKYLSQFYLNETMLTYTEVVTDKGYKRFSQVPIEQATAYAAADAHQTLQLVPILEKELREQEAPQLFYDIELPLSYVLCEMERTGIILDVELLQQLDVLVTKDIKQLEKKILATVGEEKYKDLNLNSPKQLEQLLFYDLKLPVQKKTKTGYSTDQEVLETLAKIHPVPAMIINYRELFKVKSTYIDALPTFVDHDGKIRTNFSQTSVATGRLSSSDPNLQNIPVKVGSYPVQVRTAFKPEQGHIFLSADYSQIELRVLAYLSQDANLKEAFAQERDIHRDTASKLFDVALDAVTHEQRQLGKRINFSILYGLTPFGLSKDLDIPFADAKRYIQKYFEQYPGVSAWMEGVIEETKKHGYVRTHWGRRRYLPGIYEENKTLYDLARRLAINTKAQGTAAELMKLGMLHIEEILKKQLPEAKMVLQIHDELLISVPKEAENKAKKMVKEALEKVVDWQVPLVVDIRVGQDWQEVTK